MIFDDIRTLRTINDAPNPEILKMFFYLAFHQPQEGIRGYTIEKPRLAFDLQLSRTKFFNALHWLKENLVVNEIKLVEKSDFMVNPYIVMNNGDRDARIAEWKRRCDIELAKIRKNRERRRREALKKQNQ